MKSLLICLACLLSLIAPLQLFAQVNEDSEMQSASVQSDMNAAPPETATIVVYRVPSLKGMAWTHQIFVDGVHVAGIRSREYTNIMVAPGTYEVSMGMKSNPRYLISTVNAQAGETYYIEDLPGRRLYDADRFFGIDEHLALEKIENSYKFKAPIVDEVRQQMKEQP